MRIAVTYDNGEIFQHFGHTEQFKVYEVVDNSIESSKVVDTNCGGHDALAGFLANEAVDVIICGGMGAGAEAALREAGIEIITGVSGDADKAVEAYLFGNLESEGVNCNHHSEASDEDCGCGCGSSCGGGCGGGCGGCGAPSIEGPNVGKAVRVHYRGTFNDGTQFDSSYDRGETLDFICGAGQMIKGFDQAVANMEVGQIIDIHLMPEEAYGPSDPNAIFTVEIERLPGAEELNVGEQVYLTNAYGQPFPVKVTDKTDTTITFDANSEMAGKELNFKIELVEIM